MQEQVGLTPWARRWAVHGLRQSRQQQSGLARDAAVME